MNSIIKYKKVDHNYNIRNGIVYGFNVKYYLALRLHRRHLITDLGFCSFEPNVSYSENDTSKLLCLCFCIKLGDANQNIKS